MNHPSEHTDPFLLGRRKNYKKQDINLSNCCKSWQHRWPSIPDIHPAISVSDALFGSFKTYQLHNVIVMIFTSLNKALAPTKVYKMVPIFFVGWLKKWLESFLSYRRVRVVCGVRQDMSRKILGNKNTYPWGLSWTSIVLQIDNSPTKSLIHIFLMYSYRQNLIFNVIFSYSTWKNDVEYLNFIKLQV